MSTLPNGVSIKALIISIGMACTGMTHAAEQQASFAVAVTLYSISKPLAVAQLCPQGKPLGRVNVSITVHCPEAQSALAASRTGPSNPRTMRSSAAHTSPTVLVSF